VVVHHYGLKKKDVSRSMKYISWNAGELRPPANRSEWLLLEGIKNTLSITVLGGSLEWPQGTEGNCRWRRYLVTVEYAISSGPSAITRSLQMA
jgi:hypothetical protein